MKMFQFAIASIVDANTGNGLIHGSGNLDYAAAERNGRKIRARSIAALFAAIETGLSEVVASYRKNAKQRHNLRALMKLNDHLLDDIGLSRGDLHAVRLGAVTMEALNASYRAARRSSQAKQNEVSASTRLNLELDASNERFFDSRKCA